MIDFHDFLILARAQILARLPAIAFRMIWVINTNETNTPKSFLPRPEIKNIFRNFETWEVIFEITWFFCSKLQNFFPFAWEKMLQSHVKNDASCELFVKNLSINFELKLFSALFRLVSTPGEEEKV